MKLALVQPKLRREWQLLRDGDVVAKLRIPAFRRGAAAEIDGTRLAIERQRGFREAYLVRDEGTGEERASYRRREVELGGRTLEWKHLGRKWGYGLVGADGEPLLRAKVSSGIAKTNGEVEVSDELSTGDALVAALLAAYLLIKKAEQVAASAAAATTAATST